MAAVLAGGPRALAGHTTVLPLWEMSRSGIEDHVHVSVAGSGRSRRPGIRFHRVSLADGERAVVHGIPATSPGRTLVDIAGMLGSREVELAVAHAERNGLIGGDELAALPNRYAGRPGMAMLRTLIQDRIGPDLTRSRAERAALDMIREGGLPRPHTNIRCGPYELDLFWPEEGVAIEIDGRAYHSSRARFEGDRQKDAWLRARGIEVVRLTWRQVTTDARRTAVQVGQILALARARREAVRREGPGR
jgi:very-short-patch-repair endonuclease